MTLRDIRIFTGNANPVLANPGEAIALEFIRGPDFRGEVPRKVTAQSDGDPTEIDVDKVSRITGMDITFATSANTDEEALELLKAFGLPFRKREAEATA